MPTLTETREFTLTLSEAEARYLLKAMCTIPLGLPATELPTDRKIREEIYSILHRALT